jgi:hypothetical protein
MNVVQFFFLLFYASNVEVIKPGLPELRVTIGRWLFPQFYLRIRCFSFLPAQRPRDALFQGLHHVGRSSHIRLADQQVDVLGHHHKSEQREIVPATDRGEDLEKAVPGTSGSQQRQSPVAAERDEVQVARAVPAL